MEINPHNIIPRGGAIKGRGKIDFEIWAVFRYRLFFDIGCFSIWAVFRYRLFFDMGCFSDMGYFGKK
jgi:hypothetical protein